MTKHVVSDQSDEGRLLQSLLRHGSERPEADALICGDETLSWAELRARVLHLAGAVHSSLALDAERVALIGDVSLDLAVAYLATIAAGRCAVPLQSSVQAEALKGMVGNCEPALIFVASAYRDAIADALSADTKVVCLDGGSLQRFVEDAEPLIEARAVQPETPFNIIYSSGTTGRPKGIVHSHAMRHRQTVRGLFGLGPQSTMLLATPLYSNTTLLPMLATLFHGGRVALMSKFDAEGYLDLAEKLSATHTMLVPVQYRRILDAVSFARRDLSRFEVQQPTSAPLLAEDKRRIAKEWPGRMLEVYGLTEGGCSCMLDVTRYPDKLHTVGRPQPNNDIRVVDEEGRDVAPGKRGEVIGRSPMMMSGYFRSPEATHAFYWRDKNGTIYHRTGDVGVFDEDGFLALVDRKKDVIISGGVNVYASDLEDILRNHPEVAEAAVIGVPSAKWDETPLGLIVAKPGFQPSPLDLLEWANARLGKMQRLSAIEVRAELPRSAVGKVLKQDLKRPYWEKGE
jgi:acyl-CoA synthetase (AMP-forming)/AMP-acid ligase II